MEVTVIMPVYNSQDHLEEAAESVLAQDFKDSFELILVDDCSSDGTPSILTRLEADDRVTVLRTERNAGYPTAMNLGLSHARGRYVARMDADDVWHPSLLTMVYKTHERHPDAAFVSSMRFWLTLSGKPYHMPIPAGDGYILETWQDLIDRKRHFTDVGTLFSRELSERVGGYNTYQRSGMDVDHWLRIMELTGKPCLTLRHPLVGKRLVPGSIIFQSQTTRTNEIARDLALHRTRNGLPPDHRPDEEWLLEARTKYKPGESDRRRVSLMLDIAILNLRMNDTGGFIRFAREAFSRNPLGTLKYLAGKAARGFPIGHRAGLPIVDTTTEI